VPDILLHPRASLSMLVQSNFVFRELVAQLLEQGLLFLI
jgi:hypothetical protein